MEIHFESEIIEYDFYLNALYYIHYNSSKTFNIGI